MISPSNSPTRNQDLQGASKVTGGILQGRALGNVFNYADAPEGSNFDYGLGSQKGKVHIYTSRNNMNPILVLKHDVTPTLAPILRGLACSYSPVSSKLLLIFVFNFVLRKL